MNEFSKRIFIFFLFFNKYDIGVGIARPILLFDCLSSCKDSWVLLLPVLLLQGLDLFVLVVEVLMVVFYGYFHCVVVVDCTSVLFVGGQLRLASVCPLAFTQWNLYRVKGSNLIVLCFILDGLYSFVFK